MVKMVEAKRKFVPKEMFKVGEITGTHGVRGIVRVASLTDFPEVRFKVGNEIYIDKLNREVKILSSSPHKGVFLVRLEGVDDYDMGHALLHAYIQIEKEELMPLPKGEYYHYQLIGIEIYADDVKLGTMRDVLETGANDVYIVDTVEGYTHNEKPLKEILLPAIKSCILKVNPETNRMDVKIPEGLLD